MLPKRVSSSRFSVTHSRLEVFLYSRNAPDCDLASTKVPSKVDAAHSLMVSVTPSMNYCELERNSPQAPAQHFMSTIPCARGSRNRVASPMRSWPRPKICPHDARPLQPCLWRGNTMSVIILQLQTSLPTQRRKSMEVLRNVGHDGALIRFGNVNQILDVEKFLKRI